VMRFCPPKSENSHLTFCVVFLSTEVTIVTERDTGCFLMGHFQALRLQQHVW
jgi:hypothetical protein